jgi:MOSC domain-containing protein YiiM
MTGMAMQVEALLTGAPLPFRGAEQSAIAKRPVQGPVRIGFLGLAGDSQADPVHHGGSDKAVHLYVLDHYPFWREFTGGHDLLAGPGAFGENIAASGMTEEMICLGDRFRLGSALLEVSHGRQPCWKLDHRFGRKDIMATVVRTGKCGLYFRVIEEGEAEAGEAMRLVDRSLPDWSIRRLFHLLIGGGAKGDMAAVRALAAMPVLADAWRERARKLAGV